MKQIDYQLEVNKLLGRKNINIGCVVPAYNEGSRIQQVLDVLIYFPHFSSIVLVNDGSSDNTKHIMDLYAMKSTKVRVIDISPNKGKLNAISTGINKCDCDLVCIFDSDITGLKFDYIYKMIYFVISKQFDMTILDRAGDRVSPVGWVQSWMTRIIGGERAFWKEEFKQIKFPKNGRYIIEQAMNLHYVEKGLKVRTIFCPGLYCALRFQKTTAKEAMNSYFTMFYEIYKKSMVKNIYIQAENIVEDNLEPLYKFVEKSKHKKIGVSAILIAGLFTSIATSAFFIGKSLLNKAKTKK
jgi:glycosyltransferase involved in cell wall biosynthesis